MPIIFSTSSSPYVSTLLQSAQMSEASALPFLGAHHSFPAARSRDENFKAFKLSPYVGPRTTVLLSMIYLLARLCASVGAPRRLCGMMCAGMCGRGPWPWAMAPWPGALLRLVDI
jgi:hypothetical protein